MFDLFYVRIYPNKGNKIKIYKQKKIEKYNILLNVIILLVTLIRGGQSGIRKEHYGIFN